jgi:c-di-GMP-binding flagellar brake protein YcgR
MWGWIRGDQRNWARIRSAAVDVTIHCSGLSTYRCAVFAVDLSQGGIGLQVDERAWGKIWTLAEAGAECAVELDLPHHGIVDRVKLPAKVVWTREVELSDRESGWRFGLRFTALTDTQRRRLTAFIARLVESADHRSHRGLPHRPGLV